MSKKLILIVGSSFTNLTAYLQAHDYDYIIMKDARIARQPERRLKRRIVTDFSSEADIIRAATLAQAKQPIDGIVVIYEQYIVAAARIAQHLHLAGMPISAAQACTDKQLMRELFARAPRAISPAFTVISNERDVRRFADRHGFPLILKPANLAKSLLVTKNHNLDELLSNYAKTVASIDNVYATHAPHATPKILLEEFMEGSVHSVDAFVDSSGEPHILEQVVDYETGYDVGYDDNFHYSRLLPSRLPAATVEAIRETAAMGCRALGMRSSPAHVEIILTKKGPRIVEIGARNGGYRERMHRLANKIDITGNAIRLALDEPLALEASASNSVGVFELFPRQTGTFERVAHEADIEQLASCVYYSRKVEPGDPAGRSSDGYKMCAVVILSHADPEQFARDAAFLREHVDVQITAFQDNQ